MRHAGRLIGERLAVIVRTTMLLTVVLMAKLDDPRLGSNLALDLVLGLGAGYVVLTGLARRRWESDAQAGIRLVGKSVV